jgi:hypothetical protein
VSDSTSRPGWRDVVAAVIVVAAAVTGIVL